MKKIFTLIGVIAIIGLAFFGCKEEDGKNLCTCNPKEHYLPCDCGGSDCICVVIPCGYITEWGTNAQIPIYKDSAAITDEQATAAVANIIAGYNLVPQSQRGMMQGKIAEIRITADEAGFDNISFDNSGTKCIIYIPQGTSKDDISGYLEYIVASELQ